MLARGPHESGDLHRRREGQEQVLQLMDHGVNPKLGSPTRESKSLLLLTTIGTQRTIAEKPIAIQSMEPEHHQCSCELPPHPHLIIHHEWAVHAAEWKANAATDAAATTAAADSAAADSAAAPASVGVAEDDIANPTNTSEFQIRWKDLLRVPYYDTIPLVADPMPHALDDEDYPMPALEGYYNFADYCPKANARRARRRRKGFRMQH
ncbi:hypothetical protein K438DRAFT_1966625 [Mycena galopus ATCC 62051]|nr:hypothetical protein K438DRAFT_1989021 [Mycena galopus ATCC 62051]KAF8199433.1 hypothetical protein K438DRAFT_1966625 [Mycena galopus ATCC 62051]